jgi:hypothetical protein
VQAYFAKAGTPLLAFERATGPLATGHAPALTMCRRFSSQIFPSLDAKGPNDLLSLSLHIPDQQLAAAFHLDLFDKIGLVQACTSSSGLPTSSALDPKAYPLLRQRSSDLHRMLTDYGVNV